MFFKRKKKENKESSNTPEYIDLPEDLKLTSKNLKEIFKDNEDVVFREIKINSIEVTLFFIDGLISSVETSNFVLKPLKQAEVFKLAKNEKDIIEYIEEGSIYYVNQKTRDNISDVITDVLIGCTVLIFDHEKKAITFHNYGFDRRSVSEPSGENVIKGAKDSFVETFRVNTATIRRKIKSPELKIEQVIVGKRTHTPVDIIYMNHITNDKIIDQLKKRLENIDVDGVLTTSFISEYIIDSKYTVFPQVIYTERSDKFCSDIIEGRVGIIIDGIPTSLIIPATFLQCLQAPEDYSKNYIISSIIRLMRFVLFFTTLLLPSFYTAVVTFHQEMIPSKLAIFLATAKEGVPFPSFLEVIFMLIAFEILLEAGIRLPRAIGQAVSIVGAIVVGQAAVEANLVSPAVVVIVALTAISSFAMPNQDLSNAVRLWRFVFVILASIIGLFGMVMGFLLLLLVLAKIEVLSVPYLSPFVASEYQDMDDTIFRLPLSQQKSRPYNLKTEDQQRR
ncbi:MAG: spore germination protein [Clostridia bacterium]|nr:spore germination protein [Clostridia bacterium]